MHHQVKSRPRRRFRGAAARALCSLCLLAAAATSSFAGTLASGLLSSAGADQFRCYLSNVGTKPVEVTATSVRAESGAVIALVVSTCDEPIPPGATCAFVAEVSEARGLVQFKGGPSKLRGQCQLTTDTSQILATTEMR